MSWLDALRHRLRTALRPGDHHRELEEEVSFHLELDAMQQRDADAAKRRFGNAMRYREETRGLTLAGTFDSLRQDVSYAVRSAVRSPGVTLVIALTLGLGIGANAATFVVLDRLYLRTPPGVDDPRALRTVTVEHFNTGDGVPFTAPQLNYPMYQVVREAWGERGIALFTTDYALRRGRRPGDPRLRGVYASAGYFEVVGVRAARGRLYSAEEDRLGGGARVAVVSHAYARDQLGGDSAIGRALPVGADVYTVIGILEPGFTGLALRASDVWMPLGSMPAPPWIRGTPWWESPNVYSFNAIMRPDGTPRADFEERLTTGLRLLNRRLSPQRPDTLMRAYLDPAFGLGHQKPGQDMVIGTRLGAVAIIVLIIAGANVINLLLARALVRRRETALRLALGISRARLLRSLLIEASVLASFAAVVALVMAALGGSALRSLLISDVEWTGGALDLRVGLFTIAVALLAGLVAGIVPALQAIGPPASAALKAGAQAGKRQRSRLRGAMVVVQSALAIVLLAGAALFVTSLRNVQAIDIGFDASRLLFGRVEFAEGEAPPASEVGRTLRDVASRLGTRPGVEAVARTSMEPMQGFSFTTFFSGSDSIGTGSWAGRSRDFGREMPTITAVTPSFFRAAGIRIVRGQGFTGGDTDGAPAEVVVNEAMAELLWPDREALGQCLRFGAIDAPCYTVVGVAENVRRGNVIESAPMPQYYVPSGNTPGGRWAGTTLVVRASAGTARAAETEMRAALKAAFPAGEPTVTPMSANLEPEYRPWKLGASLFTAMGVLAALVATIGIYSTVAYSVSQRTHEFGVRLALGARGGQVVRQVLRESLSVVLLGVACGVGLALAAGRLVASMLYGIRPNNALVLGLVAAMLLAVAAAAALLPARRVSRVDPVTALRAE